MNGIVTNCNQAALELAATVGMSPEKLIVELVIKNLPQLWIKSQDTISYSTKISRKYLAVNIHKRDPFANTYVARLQDITENVAVYQALFDCNSRYKAVFRNARIGLYQSTPEGEFIIVNPEFCKLLGYSDENDFLLNVSDARSIYKNPERRYKLIEKLNEQSHIISSESEFIKKDGSSALLFGTTVGVKNAEGKLIWLQGTVFDSSKKSRNELFLTKLMASLDDVNDSINIASLDDRIIYVNKAFTDLYGYVIEEIHGKTSEIFYPDIDAPNIGSTIFENTLAKDGFSGEIINKTKDGKLITVALSTSFIKDEFDEPVALMAIARDITKDREAEHKLLEAKQKAEEANALKSNIISNMSHELRTPLTGIIGFASILKDQFQDKEDESLIFIESIKKSGERLLETMNNILMLAEIESGKIKRQMQEVELGSYYRGTFKHYKDQATSSGLSLNVEADTGIIAITDPDLLRRVLDILLKNAIKFTERGGISIRIFGDADIDRAIIEVSDTGIGIEEKFLDKVFEPFTQVSSGISRKFQGTGLGLHICRSYIRLISGDIKVESTKGSGTTFRITLPSKAG
ncbi:MAG: PAS domain-containing sensor histidine kinase [Balneolales bacterium]|nr:PAS domain-containing sensor histidine kinase [Balneolales bacterium]